MSQLAVENLDVYYGAVHALKGVPGQWQTFAVVES